MVGKAHCTMLRKRHRAAGKIKHCGADQMSLRLITTKPVDWAQDLIQRSLETMLRTSQAAFIEVRCMRHVCLRHSGLPPSALQ